MRDVDAGVAYLLACFALLMIVMLWYLNAL